MGGKWPWVVPTIIVCLLAAVASPVFATGLSGREAVLYCIEVLDLTCCSDLDALYSGIHDPAGSDHLWAVSISREEQEYLAGYLAVAAEGGMAHRTEDFTRSSHLLVLMGSQARFASGVHCYTQKGVKRQELVLNVRPVRIVEGTKIIVTEVAVGMEGGRLHSTAAMVTSVPGERVPVAAIRRVRTKEGRTTFGKRGFEETRDFVVCLSASAVDIEEHLSSSSVVLSADLYGLSKALEEPIGKNTRVSVKGEIDLLIGISEPGAWSPVVDVRLAVGESYAVEFGLCGPESLYMSARRRLKCMDGVSLEVIAGTDIGSGVNRGIVFGVGDEVRPGDGLMLFGKVYPTVFRLDPPDFAGAALWEAGARLEGQRVGTKLILFGDPHPMSLEAELSWKCMDKAGLVLTGTWVFQDGLRGWLGLRFQL